MTAKNEVTKINKWSNKWEFRVPISSYPDLSSPC